MAKEYKPPIPTEFEEQRDFCEWLTLKNIRHTAIPNSTYTRSWSQKTKNKQSGLNRGLPDLLICLPLFLVFIEMKRTKNCKLGDEQKKWIESLNKYDCVLAKVCYGFNDAKAFIEDCLKSSKEF